MRKTHFSSTMRVLSKLRCLGVIAVLISVFLPPLVLAGEAAGIKNYVVSLGGQPVLKIKDQPGTLSSTALPALGTSPPVHPFLTASALVAAQENHLRQILDGSMSTQDFIEKLRRAGYVVTPE